MLKKLVHEYTLKLAVGLAVTSTITVFAIISKIWNWPNAVVGAILLLCGILFLMDRLGIGPSLKSRVRDWLDSTSFGVTTVQDSNEFHFRMTDNVGIVADIWQPKPDYSIVIMSGHHKATSQQLGVFNAMAKQAQDTFWKNVRLELLRYGISFSNLALDGDGVALSTTITPSLSSDDFLKALLFVRSGARLYWELLGNLNPPATATDLTGSTPDSLLPPPSQA